MKAVEPKQKWVHTPSGDVRVVLAIVPYEEASGGWPPPEHSRVTHVAVMVHEDGRRDRRDSSDMELVPVRFGGFVPAHGTSWRLFGLDG